MSQKLCDVHIMLPNSVLSRCEQQIRKHCIKNMKQCYKKINSEFKNTLNSNYIYSNKHFLMIYSPHCNLSLCEKCTQLNTSILFKNIINRCFNGAKLTFTLKVITFAKNQKKIDYIFSRITKCVFLKFKTNKKIQKHCTLCILTLNIINEKTCNSLIFWFLLLKCISTLIVTYWLSHMFVVNNKCKFKLMIKQTVFILINLPNTIHAITNLIIFKNIFPQPLKPQLKIHKLNNGLRSQHKYKLTLLKIIHCLTAGKLNKNANLKPCTIGTYILKVHVHELISKFIKNLKICALSNNHFSAFKINHFIVADNVQLATVFDTYLLINIYQKCFQLNNPFCVTSIDYKQKYGKIVNYSCTECNVCKDICKLSKSTFKWHNHSCLHTMKSKLNSDAILHTTQFTSKFDKSKNNITHSLCKKTLTVNTILMLLGKCMTLSHCTQISMLNPFVKYSVLNFQ